MNVEQLGMRLSNYRKNNNMTIKEFSRLSKVSTALLSQLERGKGNPSFTVLESIASTMNISMSALFEDTIKLEQLVRRVDDQPVLLDITKDNMEFQLLTAKSNNVNDDLIRVTVKPYSETPYYPFGEHDCDEIILVEKGSITIYDSHEDSTTLKKGDTMRIVANLKYKIKNLSSHTATMLYIASSAKEIL